MLRSVTYMCCGVVCCCAALVAGGEDAEDGGKTDGKIVKCILSVKAGKDAYRIDEPVELLITLENNTDKVVEVRGSGGLLRIYKFDLRLGKGGMELPLTLEGKRQSGPYAGSLHFKAVEPGQVASMRVPMLNRLYDMTLGGEYVISVSQLVAIGTEEAKLVRVFSEPIAVRVHEGNEKVTTRPTGADKGSGNGEGEEGE